MTLRKRAPCSDQSLLRGDPMYGTASAGSSWVLLELPGGWGPSAFLQSPAVIDPELGRAIVRRVEGAKMRIAAIRRHGRRTDTPRWRWFIARAVVGGEALYAGEVDNPRDYLDLALDGSDGTLSTDPVVAVCAHGRHDQCCAVRGRGAIAAIADAYPEMAWECSHLGGDRFAATMLILPEGLCYGRVDSTDAAELVRLYLDGRLDNRYLRGRTSLPHAVQAAQYFAREKYGDDRIAGLPTLSAEHTDHRHRVVLGGESGPVEVTVEEGWSEPLLSQCHAKVPGRVKIFSLVSITPA
ncbi:sucrase ferredoxin [Mycolicibacterium monacense]|uniref:Sucrase ferredoxin n=2 Tax=Mycobacteriaceae TaxID=1762 RepID=A0AAD1IZN8_MYCMB|nr:sucrase ferredoxin [Mycolicibacterium monacense]MDA4103343.1 sucraseferredoxin [Mycolicibacterium monacense DSM 44395]OBB58873.1 sucrase ferredoxin [Mycolicibacterium monacense]OBF56550.1 sucrase ferredoxin [Mycolicibacterium monacense]ORB21134.1 sucrase ferredoxin [Mycolicibacterium monacense DSM 44395]QHP88935.1 sucrase ferredoxin [Mycolicibacterium monacense DSM 44395]